MIGQGDYLQAQINYTQGALRYAFQTPNSNYGKVEGADLGFGVLSDAVYGGTVVAGNATQLNLTTAWNINAAYEHFWNPQWRTSLYGGYGAVSYNEQANNMLCSFAGAGAGTGTGTAAVATPGCNMDWSTWWLGSRTQWNVTKDFYMGFDVLYSKLQQRRHTEQCRAGQRGHSAMRRLSRTPTTGSSASACTAISIPDRGIAA